MKKLDQTIFDWLSANGANTLTDMHAALTWKPHNDLADQIIAAGDGAESDRPAILSAFGAWLEHFDDLAESESPDSRAADAQAAADWLKGFYALSEKEQDWVAEYIAAGRGRDDHPFTTG